MPRTCRRLFVLALLLPLAACTDHATRVAFQLQRETYVMRLRGQQTRTVRHIPSDCDGPYRIQFTANSLIGVWCHDAAGRVVGSSVTTSHLNHVQVPRTTVLDKRAGEPTWIDLARGTGKPMVTAVR